MQITVVYGCTRLKGLSSMSNDDRFDIEDINTDKDALVQSEDLSSLGELAAVDDMLAEAAAATDEGDFKGALSGFENALEVTQRIFGDNIELTELKHKIADIHELLDEQDS